MHQTNIDTLRQEAQRQLKLLKSLLSDAQQKGLIGAPAQTRATFDTESLPKTIEVLDGEHYKLEHLDMVLAVVGTMKAGKSTSINAIVGAEVLPNRNRPMTALPTLIRHTPGVLVPRLQFEKIEPLNDLLKQLHSAVKKADATTRKELESDADMQQLLTQIEQRKPFASQHSGEEGIFEFLKGLNDLVRLCFTLTKSGVEADFPFDAYSKVDAMPVIEMEFSHLKGIQATQGRLTLLDTPGPNEAGQTHLRKMLQDQLEKASAVLAVLDYTQLKSDADEDVRKNLIEIAETAKDRMYALINKFDQKDRNSDDASTVKQYVAQTLMKGAMTGDDVFPVSSKHGYLASRARNEIKRHGKLNLQEAWANDFAEAAFAALWEESFAEEPEKVKKGADRLWERSGFVQPLEQVIVKAHRNAALEALRSATSKLVDIARDAGDFFNISRDALTKDAEALQKNINNLQQDIDSINHVEADTEAKLKHALDGMKQGIRAKTEAAQRKIQDTLQDHLRDGKVIEDMIAKKEEEYEKENIEENNLNTNKFLSELRKMAKSFAGIDTATKRLSSVGSDKKYAIITFDDKENANNFRGEIEKSVRDLFKEAEDDFQSCIKQGISKFNKDLDHQRQNALENIKKSVQKNLDGFDIEIHLPKPKPISLDTSVAEILKDAVEEKTKKVTRSRRQQGVWGTVCSWFGTDDWGWEEYQVDKDFYEVDLERIFQSSDQGLETLFNSAHSALDQNVYSQMQAGVDEFFKTFRQKIEHIRGDLMKSIQDHRLNEDQKKEILADSTQMAKAASGLGKDCEALDERADSLYRQERVVMVRGEVMA